MTAPSTHHRRTPSSRVWRIRLLALGAGILAALVALELALRLAGWGTLLWQAHRNPLPEDHQNRFRVLCVGESTSAGFYPALLEVQLNRRAGRSLVWVINRAEAGADTSTILSSLENDLVRYRPHMVVAMMGANDYGGAFPQSDVPVAMRRGPFERIKVLKLAWYLSYTVPRELERVRRGESDRAGSMEADLTLSGVQVDLPGPIRELVEAERRGRRAQGRHPSHGTRPEVAPAEAALREVIRSDPSSVGAWLLLADLLKHVRRDAEALEILRQATEQAPGHAVTYVWLGNTLMRHERYEEALDAYARAIDLDPKTFRAWSGRVAALRALGRDQDVDEVMERALSSNPDSDVVLGLAAHHALRAGRTEEAEALFRRANDLRMQYFCPMTVQNYRHMHAALSERGIGLVAVPYPFRTVEPLQWILEDREGVWFVDHLETWRQALDQHGYDALFFDHCNGDSGHGTRLGDGILAESVADVLWDACDLERWRP